MCNLPTPQSPNILETMNPIPSIIMQPTYCTYIQVRYKWQWWHLPDRVGPSSLTFAHCRKQVTVLLDCPEKQVLTAVPKDGLGIVQSVYSFRGDFVIYHAACPVAIIVSCAACNAALAMLSVSTLKLVHLVSNSNAAGESISIPFCSLS